MGNMVRLDHRHHWGTFVWVDHRHHWGTSNGPQTSLGTWSGWTTDIITGEQGLGGPQTSLGNMVRVDPRMGVRTLKSQRSWRHVLSKCLTPSLPPLNTRANTLM